GRKCLLRLGAILLIQTLLSRFEIRGLPIDENLGNPSPGLERVAGGDNQIGGLALFDGTESFRHAEDLGGVQRNRLVRFFGRESKGYRGRGLIREIPDGVGTESRDGKFYAG